jgi:hypothetical protein
MKNRNLIFILSITSMLLFASCKKYSEDKFISTYTPSERLTKFGSWKLQSATKGGVELFNINDTSSIGEMFFSFDASKDIYSVSGDDNTFIQCSNYFKSTFSELLKNPTDSIDFGYVYQDFQFSNSNKNLLLEGLIFGIINNGQYYRLDIEFEIKRLELAYMTLAYKDLEIKFKKVKN